MGNKYLNTLIIILQAVFTVLLSVYLIVPVYDLSPKKLWGTKVHSPYENWRQSPINQISIDDRGFVNSSDEKVLRLYSYKGIDHIFVIDSTEASTYNPFLLSSSINDIQYLLRKSEDEIILMDVSKTKEASHYAQLKGVDLISITKASDLDLADMHLNYGHPISLLAGASDSLFCYNQVLNPSNKNGDVINSLKNGHNLILLSTSNLEANNMDKIPVIREIRWEDPELYIDLSEFGNIKVVSSDYTLDTLSQSIKVKLPNVSWFRFQVDFAIEGFHYISNPYFRYNNIPFEQEPIKANNQLTIFTNLSWLLGIIILNVLINMIRKRYL